MPQVMQDFAFERTGDRVRIVDADGSIYEGAVMPAPAEQNRSKSLSQLDSLKERKDTLSEQTQSADLQPSYRFYASGVNRKLNQTVEFRGEWQPAVPSQAGQGTSALQPVSFGTTQLELQAAEKKDKAAGAVTLADTPTSAKANFNQLQKESGLGRITGRAVVGGRNEFDINAVPK